jgi:hypothetical protein
MDRLSDDDARSTSASVLDGLGASFGRADRVAITCWHHRFTKFDRVRLRKIEDGRVSRFCKPLPELLLDALLLSFVHPIIIPPPVGTAQIRRSGTPWLL